jgi:hypothetical protein
MLPCIGRVLAFCFPPNLFSEFLRNDFFEQYHFRDADVKCGGSINDLHGREK